MDAGKHNISDNNIASPPAKVAACTFVIIWGMALLLHGFVTLTNHFTHHPSFEEVWRGTWAQEAEKAFDTALPWQDISARVWGTLRYEIFSATHPDVVVGDKGWLFTSEEFEVPAEHHQHLKQNITFVQRVHQNLTRQGATLIIVLVPSKARVYGNYLDGYTVPKVKHLARDRFVLTLREEGIEIIDVSSVMGLHASTSPSLFFQADTHWTPQGARIAAHHVAKAFHNKSYRRMKTLLTPTKPIAHSGDLLLYNPTLLHVDSAQLVMNYTLQQELTTSLFDNVSTDFALVGTSYSADDRWHFADFLRDELQADILNMAQKGVGGFAPMQAYLDWVDSGHKASAYVLWEIPERYLTFAPSYVSH